MFEIFPLKLLKSNTCFLLTEFTVEELVILLHVVPSENALAVPEYDGDSRVTVTFLKRRELETLRSVVESKPALTQSHPHGCPPA